MTTITAQVIKELNRIGALKDTFWQGRLEVDGVIVRELRVGRNAKGETTYTIFFDKK